MRLSQRETYSEGERDARLQSSRREFLQRGALVLAGAATCGRASLAWAADAEPAVRMGLLADVHYAERDPRGTLYFRESLAKVREAVAKFNRCKVTVALELGDFIDAAPDLETEIRFLQAVEGEYAKFIGDRHYVLGNHCVTTLTKQEFLDNCGAKKAHYSFDADGFHFVILDACYRADGVAYERKNFNWTDSNIPPAELKWLEADLKATGRPTLVFVHQRLDSSDVYSVRNAPAVRNILETSGKVLAVFMGHTHVNAYCRIGGIHYCAIRAVVEGSGLENSGYAIVDVYKDGSIRIEGFQKQKSYDLRQRA